MLAAVAVKFLLYDTLYCTLAEIDQIERTIVINHGRITADGPSLEIFNNQRLLEENHLEKPLTLQIREGYT